MRLIQRITNRENPKVFLLASQPLKNGLLIGVSKNAERKPHKV
jgi:hypothetical protein